MDQAGKGSTAMWHLEHSLNLYPMNESLSPKATLYQLPPDPPPAILGGIIIYLTNGLEPLNPLNILLNSSADAIVALFKWSIVPDTFVTMAERSVPGFPSCAPPQCSPNSMCRIVYACLRDVWLDMDQAYLGNARLSGGPFAACLRRAQLTHFRCGLWVISLRTFTNDNCLDESYKLSPANWEATKTSENMQIFRQGGQDSEGVSWPGQPPDETFSQSLGSQLTKIGDYHCSLENPCTYKLQCDGVGSWSSIQQGTAVLQSIWGYFAIIAMQNINQHLTNQWIAIKGALGLLALDTFQIKDFFPRPDAKLNIVNALTGLGTIFAIVGGFVPVVGPVISGVGAGLPAVGTFLGNAAAKSANPDIGQELFVPRVREIYTNYIEALDIATIDLLAGRTIGDQFDIFGMMAEGAWLNSSALPRVSSLETSLRTEILSRSIDQLWKKPTSNKIWVLFVDLFDDRVTRIKCLEHKKGPETSKYCADGGVYYTYNYIEDGEGRGFVGYPWGANLLMEKFEIDFKWVTEASAKTYKLAKDHKLRTRDDSIDPFNVSGQLATELFLNQFVKDASTSDLLNQEGRYPGSWTLPVCNASTWGADWNWDYTSPDFKGSQKASSHPPCLCGDKGTESDQWARAAGMYDFDTFHERCKRALESDTFKWPEGVTSVTYPSPRNFTIRKPGS